MTQNRIGNWPIFDNQRGPSAFGGKVTLEIRSGVCYFEGLHSKLDSGSLTLLMQLELLQHFNHGNASEESDEREGH